jgi:hypothetical protein
VAKLQAQLDHVNSRALPHDEIKPSSNGTGPLADSTTGVDSAATAVGSASDDQRRIAELEEQLQEARALVQDVSKEKDALALEVGRGLLLL